MVVLLLGLILASQFLPFPLAKAKESLLWARSNFGWEAAIIGAIVYAILLSIPFFPGVELGWLIIMLYGKDSIILIYLFTLLGLIVSFSVGRWLGTYCVSCQSKLERFNQTYSATFNRLVEKVHGFFSQTRCSLVFNRILQKSPYFVLAILINIPGNSLVGGGGGIALLSGLNRAISFKGFVITLIIAVSPLPILLYFGLVQVEKLLF